MDPQQSEPIRKHPLAHTSDNSGHSTPKIDHSPNNAQHRLSHSPLSEGRTGRRRRLSVSTVDPPSADENPTLFNSAPRLHSNYSENEQKPNLNLSTAVAAISRDETMSTPVRRDRSAEHAQHESPESASKLRPTLKPLSESQPNLTIPPTPAKRGRRLSVSGRIAQGGNTEIDYQLKEVAIKHSNDFQMDTIKDQLIEMGIGYACHKGLKPESPNQDDFFIIRIDDWGLYGVFDGHGPFGHDVSNFVQREFPKQLYGPDFLAADGTRITNCMTEAFEKVQKKLEAYCNQPSIRTCCSLSGTTASIVYHRINEKRLIIAHVGDSRVVMGRRNPNGTYTAEDLAIDHKPDNESEKKRIYERGGVVKRISGDIPHRVFLQGKMFPGLAMSRAIGDLVAHKAGVICTPDVLDYKIKPEDEFLILASDGIWEFIDSQEAVNKIAQYSPDQLSECVEELCSEAWKRWREEEGNVVDDITLEIIYINR